MTTKTKLRWDILLIAALGLLILVLLITGLARSHRAESDPAPTPAPTAAPTASPTPEPFSVVTVEDGLRDMGVLVTGEYYFTKVIHYSDPAMLFNTIHIPIGDSELIASYDGRVTAGVDFSAVGVTVDHRSKTVTVSIPEAAILDTVIDHDSLQIYTEKNGLFNGLTMEDLNTSLVELEKAAAEDAVEKGLLTSAGGNARLTVESFVSSLLAGTGYTVTVL